MALWKPQATWKHAHSPASTAAPVLIVYFMQCMPTLKKIIQWFNSKFAASVGTILAGIE